MTPNNKACAAIVAVVDDDKDVRDALKSLLRSCGYKPQTYSCALDFLNASDLAETQCLISDIQMPGMNGVEMHTRLLTMGFCIPTIFITAHPAAAPHLNAHTPKFIACLTKPFDPEQLFYHIEVALLG